MWGKGEGGITPHSRHLECLPTNCVSYNNYSGTCTYIVYRSSKHSPNTLFPAIPFHICCLFRSYALSGYAKIGHNPYSTTNGAGFRPELQ